MCRCFSLSYIYLGSSTCSVRFSFQVGNAILKSECRRCHSGCTAIAIINLINVKSCTGEKFSSSFSSSSFPNTTNQALYLCITPLSFRLRFNINLEWRTRGSPEYIMSSRRCIAFRISASRFILCVQFAFSSLGRVSLTLGSYSTRTLFCAFMVSIVSSFWLVLDNVSPD